MSVMSFYHIKAVMALSMTMILASCVTADHIADISMDSASAPVSASPVLVYGKGVASADSYDVLGHFSFKVVARGKVNAPGYSSKVDISDRLNKEIAVKGGNAVVNLRYIPTKLVSGGNDGFILMAGISTLGLGWYFEDQNYKKKVQEYESDFSQDKPQHNYVAVGIGACLVALDLITRLDPPRWEFSVEGDVVKVADTESQLLGVGYGQ